MTKLDRNLIKLSPRTKHLGSSFGCVGEVFLFRCQSSGKTIIMITPTDSNKFEFTYLLWWSPCCELPLTPRILQSSRPSSLIHSWKMYLRAFEFRFNKIGKYLLVSVRIEKLSATTWSFSVEPFPLYFGPIHFLPRNAIKIWAKTVKLNSKANVLEEQFSRQVTIRIWMYYVYDT